MIRCKAVCCKLASRSADARRLAEQLGLPLQSDDVGECEFALEFTNDRLQLRLGTGSDPLAVDFSRPGIFQRDRSDALVRAVEGRQPRGRTIWDCTAGLGTDAFVLANAGHHVVLIERHPDLVALVTDGLRRAELLPNTAEAASRMQLVCCEAVDFLLRPNEFDSPDVIYLDPLFPASGKDALPKKAMQWLRAMGEGGNDEAALFAAALRRAKEKVVVKRPARGPRISDNLPTYSVSSRLLRFDVYTL